MSSTVGSAVRRIEHILVLGMFLLLTACGGSGGSGGGGGGTYTLSGTISGASAVTVTLSGAASQSTTTGTGGSFSFTGLANGAYTVTPTLAGYTFSPANLAVTVNGANLSAQNFTATAVTSTYSITGAVSNPTGGAQSGVLLTLSGAGAGTQTSDTSGAYTFANLGAGSYTITPSLAGYTFAPATATVAISGANQTATTFVATPIPPTTYSLSGSISGAVMAGVTINVSGAATASTTSSSNGAYTVANLAAGNYVVTPSLSGYTFSPVSSNVTISSANVAGTNFTASANVAPTYTISGTVSGPWASGVTISLAGQSTGTTTTDASGNYSFAGLAAGNYTLTANLVGYSFSPSPASVALSATTAQNFSETAAGGGYTISGTLSYAGSKTGLVNVGVYYDCPSGCGNQQPSYATAVHLSGSAGAYSGTYTIRGVTPGAYLVVAQIDTLGTGQLNVSNPIGVSSAQTVGGANLNNVNISITDPGAVAPVAPHKLQIAAENAVALVQYGHTETAINSSVQAQANTGYKIYWGSDTAASNGGSKTFSVGGTNSSVFLLTGIPNGPLYFKMTGLVGSTESAPTAVVGPVTIGATSGANSVSGTVSFPGTATGPLIVGVYGSSGIYYSVITNPVSPQSYSIAGVPSGGYNNFAWIDMNGNGMPDVGDLTNVNFLSPFLNVTTNLTGANVTLTAAPEQLALETNHIFDGTNNSYQLVFVGADGAKRAVAMTLYSGPNVSLPVDLGPLNGNYFFFNPVNPATAPSVGDSYQFLVTYSDGSTSTLTASVNGVSNAFATSPQVNTASPYSRNVPQFQWAAPNSPPANYTYSFNLNGPDTNWNYPQQSSGLPSTTLSVVYDSDGTASLSSLTSGTSYNWQIIVQDQSTGNYATYQAPAYTP